MQTVSLELTEVISTWLKDPTQLNCRISTKSVIQVIRFQKNLTFELPSASSTDQVHILIQEDNIVLGSLTVTLEWMFGSDLLKVLDDWISIEVPIESIMLITKKQPNEIPSKSLKLRLTGKVIRNAVLVVKASESKAKSPARSPRGFEIKIEEPEEDKKQPVFHRKLPSEADSLEKEPQNPPKKDKKKISKSRSPQPQSPKKSPIQSPREFRKSSKSPSSGKESNTKNLVQPNSVLKSPSPSFLSFPENENLFQGPQVLEIPDDSLQVKSPQSLTPKDKSPKSLTPREKSPKSLTPREKLSSKPLTPREKSPQSLAPKVKSPVRPITPREFSSESMIIREASPPKALTPTNKSPSKSPKGLNQIKKNQAPLKSPIEVSQKVGETHTKIQPTQKSPVQKSSKFAFPDEQVKKYEEVVSELPKQEKKALEKLSDNENVSLNSSVLSSDDEKPEIQEEPIRRRPEKMHLTAASIFSPCNYYTNIAKSEWHLTTIMSILAKLKEDMGNSFLKLIEESTRRDSRSPTRSPSRKITNSGLRTPLVSQRSLNASVISAFRVEEENIIEVQGNVDVFLDRLSIKNVEILAICICGLLSKNTSALSQLGEIEPTKFAINGQDKAKNMITDSIKATQSEFDQEKENYEILIKRVKDEITMINQNIEATRKKTQLTSHDKQNYEKKLKKLQNEKKDIMKKFNASVNLDEIKQMKKAIEQLDKGRVEFEEKLSSLSNQYKNVFDSAANIQNKYIEEKAGMLGDLKALNSTLENIERENHKVKSEMQGHTGFIYVDDELHRMLLSYQSNSRSHFSNLDSMRTQLTFLRSQKEDLATDALALQQKIEAETKRVRNSQASWNREIEANAEVISRLREEFKKIRGEVAHIEEAYNKKVNVESTFETIHGKTKHNQDTKDQLMSEISYFSDFVFSISQTFLQQKRIFDKVKIIVEEKEMEVEAMRTAVFDLKSSNPVYFPVSDDPIDQAVADYFNSRDEVLLVPFLRESFGVYIYGSKKIMVSIERGKLIVKVGGGFLPIEVFLENYTDTELEKFDKKELDASPKMKKFMAKWVGGLNPVADSPQKIKERLIKAMEGHKFTQAYAVRETKPQPVIKKHEDFLTPPRAETPIIEEDI